MISNTYFYLGVIILILIYMTQNVIYIGLSIMLLLFLYKNQKKYKILLDNIVEIDDSDNGDQHYNDNIKELLKKIKRYKKYNLNDYNSGIRYFHKFMDTIHKLENRHLKHKRQYIENAKLYLNKSINHLQYITFSTPDRSLLQGLKYDDYESTKKSKKLHKIINDLYETSFDILLTLTFENNEITMLKPDIYKGLVDLNIPEGSNYYDDKELY